MISVVVVRHLQPHDPVACYIKLGSAAPDYVDSVESWLTDEANTYIEEFKSDFPEFRQANFHIQFLEV